MHDYKSRNGIGCRINIVCAFHIILQGLRVTWGCYDKKSKSLGSYSHTSLLKGCNITVPQMLFFVQKKTANANFANTWSWAFRFCEIFGNNISEIWVQNWNADVGFVKILKIKIAKSIFQNVIFWSRVFFKICDNLRKAHFWCLFLSETHFGPPNSYPQSRDFHPYGILFSIPL